MPSTATLLTFSLAAAALVVVPGPSVVYVVARGMEFGRRAGMVSVAGLEVGSLLHLVATVAGLAALLAAWPAGFRLLQWAGAAYLLGLAVSPVRARRMEVRFMVRQPLTFAAAAVAELPLEDASTESAIEVGSAFGFSKRPTTKSAPK